MVTRGNRWHNPATVGPVVPRRRPRVSTCIMRIAAAVLVASGCSQQVYSPPAQTFAVSPVHSLASQHAALEMDVSNHAAIFDPAIHALDGRYRRGIGENAEVSLEGAAHQVEGNGRSTAPREFYSGRAGISVTPEAGDMRLF